MLVAGPVEVAMLHPFGEGRPGSSRRRRRPVTWMVRLWGLLFLVGCAAATKPPTLKPDIVRSHVYPLPLDNVLAQTARLMQKKGWGVKRAGNALLTNWHGTADDAHVTYRIFGERIDAGLCTIRVVRLVATKSTDFGTDHPVTESAMGRSILSVNPEFVADTVSDSAAGTAPPAGVYSPADLARPSPWVVTEHTRDAVLELEFQREIDPTPDLTADSSETPTLAGSSPEASTVDLASPSNEGQLTDLAGIWEGTFKFRGNMTGSYSGEIAVAVEHGSAEVADFCPDQGGTLTAMGSGEVASWQGELACPPISIKGCTSSVIKYNSARAALKGSTLVLVAAGNVETPAACGYSSGALSVAFVAQKADYVHIAVTRVPRATSCVWPSDWEDFNSIGSMAMPERPGDDSAYLGVIRARGSRLSEIERLLRECHQVVRFHGQAVLMRLAATHPRPK
jgi:hypothetical protein